MTGFWVVAEHTGLSLLTEVGIALFILGSITITMELADFMEYFVTRLTDIMIKDKYIDRLTDEQKESVKRILEEKLYFKDQQHDPNSFFYTVQNEVIPLLNDCYYNEYRSTVQCYIEGNVIRKRVHRKLEIVNPKHERICQDIPFETKMKKISGVDDSKLYKVISYQVDTIDKTKELNLPPPAALVNDEYDLVFCGKHVVNIQDKCVIEYEIETIVPIEDIHYMNRVFKPCKLYTMIFILHDQSNEYDLTGHGFGFMDKEKLVKQLIDGGVIFEFKDWIFPGNGVMLTIVKKTK